MGVRVPPGAPKIIGGLVITSINYDNDIYFYNLLKQGIFCVDKDGNIYKKGKLLKYKGNKHNYRRIVFESVGIQAHRLIWIAHNGLIPINKELNHKDGIKTNNHPSNLELVTGSENIKHAYKIGLNKVSDELKVVRSNNMIGERNSLSKLTDKEVIKIRKLYKENKITKKEIEAKHSLCRRTVENMLKGVSYSHLPYKIKKREDISKEVAKLYLTGKYNKSELARKFSISRGKVRSILAKSIPL